MKANLSKTLRTILDDTAQETAWCRSRQSLKRLKQMLKDAPEIISFRQALSSRSGLIAEIKEESPSQGKMVAANVASAPLVYKNSRIVKAISVLTNRTHFGKGMTLTHLRKVKELSKKPVLRKDFITEEYQIYQARAHGADAILLMANILERDELSRLSEVAFELGMDVLFETHSVSELEDVPSTASLIGINCRNFDSHPNAFKMSKILRQWLWGVETDKSVKLARFDYADQLPAHAIKVAESGVTVGNCAHVFSLGFNAALVGTSLLMDRRGIQVALAEFETAITGAQAPAVGSKALAPAIA